MLRKNNEVNVKKTNLREEDLNMRQSVDKGELK